MRNNKEISEGLSNLEIFLDSKGQSKFYFFGEDFWPVIRTLFAFSLISSKQSINNEESQSYFKKKPKMMVKNPENLIVTHSNYFIEIDNKYYDRVMSSLSNISNRNLILNLEDLSLMDGSITYKIGSILYKVKILKAISMILAPLLSLNPNYQKNLRLIYEAKKELNLDFKISRFKVMSRIAYIFFLSKFLEKFLKRLKVKKIYQAIYYDNFGFALSLAADRLKLLNVCMQHGGQSQHNPAFGNWNLIDKDGYKFLPNIFSCWDEKSSIGLRKLVKLTNKHKVQIDGYKWLTTFKSIKPDNSVSSLRNENKINLLITLQPSFQVENSFVIDFLEKNNKKINLLIRLHPRQISLKSFEFYKNIFSKMESVDIETISKNPLLESLSIADFHLTAFSSSIFEANFLGIKSILIDNRGKNYFNDYIDGHNISFADNTKSLEKLIFQIDS